MNQSSNAHRALALRAFARLVAERFRQHRCSQAAGSLAFTTLLSLVPALAIFLAMFSISPYFAGFAKSFRNFLLTNVVPEAGKVLTGYMTQFAEHAARLTTAGTLLLSLSVLLLLLALDQAFNVIWLVQRERPLWKRVLRYSLAMVLGPLAVGVLLGWATRWLGTALGWAPGLNVVGAEISEWIPFIALVGLLTLLLRSVPKHHVPWRDAFLGAVFTAIGLEVMRAGFAVYVKHVGSFRLIYGAFASVPIFLIWLYCTWVVILLGAVLTATLPYWGKLDAHALPTPARLREVAAALLDELRLGAIELGGRGQGWQRLATRCEAPYDVLGAAADRLIEGGLVRQQRGSLALTAAGQEANAETIEGVIFGSGTQQKLDHRRDLVAVEEHGRMPDA